MIPAALAQAVAAADALPLEGAVGLIRPFLADIGWFSTLLEEQLAAMAADPLHLPGLRASRNGAARHLVIARTERVRITATLIDPTDQPPMRVHFSGRVVLSRSLNGPLRGEQYRLVQGRALSVGEGWWATGAVVETDEREEALCLYPGGRSLMVLRAQVAPPGPVHARIHDPVWGTLLGSAQVDEGHARALMLLSLLRVQGRRDAADCFSQALDTPLAAQRWAVMREYLALDTHSALPALRAMAREEADAAVRALAMRTLTQIGDAPCLA
ncbi:hypothetical protein Q4610_05815 [Sphingobium sp. HBC34]|uniref:HEAT repeat domain-containing protein n=1 Tax=Sphingobium cyanobacteriorum TaxID=3063954 RepID=A0ABT8ZJN5_9SPHN|nr:hypothetical protein [Sphingobium sp. HBC34]MDO7834558.1 hypothetical protein [Sphingobium sp. HBC34]